MKEILKKVLIALFIGAGMIYLIASAISDLSNTDDRRTVHINAATEILNVEHSINGLIPIGTDHYYIGMDILGEKAYIIHASPGWYSSNFDTESGWALAPERDMELSSLVKPVSDYKVSSELTSRAKEHFSIFSFPLGAAACFEIDFQFVAVMKLVLVLLTAVLAAAGWWIIRNKDSIPRFIAIIYAVLLFGAAALLVFVLR